MTDAAAGPDASRRYGERLSDNRTAAGVFAGVELTIVPAAGQVHMISRPGGGGNVGVFASPDGVLLVDSLVTPLA